MRTSYNRNTNMKDTARQECSIQDNCIEKQENNEDMIMHAKLIETYNDLDNELALIREEELMGYSDALKNNAEDYANIDGELENRKNEILDLGLQDSQNSNVVVKKKKISIGKKVGIGIGIFVLVIGTGVFVRYNKIVSERGTVDSLQTRIEKLYTSEDQVDIKSNVSQGDLNEFYMDLLKLQKKGNDVDKPIEELDTIGYYLNDKSILMEYLSDDYDLTTTGMIDSVNNIEDNTKKYTVSGLAVTINNMATKVLEEYDNFIALRQELNGISDVISFDEENYKLKIDSIKHTPNKIELQAICDKLVVDKQAAIAQKDVEEAADEQARADAEQALLEVQELQKKTQEELEETKKKLEEEAEKKLKESVKGNEVKEKTNENNEGENNSGVKIEPIVPMPVE